MIKKTLFTIVILSLLSYATHNEKKNLIKGQSQDFPLYTVLDTATTYPLIQRLTTSYQLNTGEVDSFFATITPLLEEEDPLAMLGFYLAYNNEIVSFMYPDQEDKKYDYLQRLADLNCSSAELIIFEDFFKGKYNFTSDPEKAFNYLERAILHGDEFNSAYGNLIMAEIYCDPKNNFNIAVDSIKGLEKLKLAIESGNYNMDLIARMKLPKLYKKLEQ